jgi:hypothetical protein
VPTVAEALAVSWNTANAAILAEGRRVPISDRARFDGVHVIGVDEHVSRHTRRGDKYVTVIMDLRGIRDGAGGRGDDGNAAAGAPATGISPIMHPHVEPFTRFAGYTIGEMPATRPAAAAAGRRGHRA